MSYTRDHFDIQLRFARFLTERFSLNFEQVLRDYTTFTMSFGTGEEWSQYIAGLAHAQNETDWTYAFYLPRCGEDATPETTAFHGHLLFGCFYFAIRDEHIVRTHFVRNDLPEPGALSRDRVLIRKQELRAMFVHIRKNVAVADTVLGNSWLYNLEAYRRLFPPEYTRQMEVADFDDFPYMARWGQFFDKHGNVKPSLSEEFFHRLENITRLEEVRGCFPFQILRPRCSIERFFEYYDIP